MRHILLVGATDGIGLALARHYLDRSCQVAIVGRSPEKLRRVAAELARYGPPVSLSAVVCDVTEASRVPVAFEEALERLGQLDALIYCAGLMDRGEDPGAVHAAAREMFAVNVLAAIHWCELAAEYLVGAGRGQIAAIGSVAGDRGRKGNPSYHASKAALETYLEGLRHRLHGTGVRVSTVKPGFVRTRMLKGMVGPGAIEPEEAARRIADGLTRGREVFYVPGRWRLASYALRLTPRFFFKRFGPP